MEELHDITAVEVIGEHRLRLSFDDGTIGDVDFSTREWPGVFAPLADPANFEKVQVNPESGTISWPGDLDMAPEPLYEAARRHLVVRQ